MTIKGMYRQDVYELPTDSIRELIANAVAHRSYLEPGNIQVALYDDRLEKSRNRKSFCVHENY